MTAVSEKVLQKIKERKITVIPRWHFVLKNICAWLLFILFTFAGAIVCGLALFMFIDMDWEFFSYLNESPGRFLAMSIPYLWIVALSVLVFIAYLYARRTKMGYKHRTFALASISLLLSLGFGVSMNAMGLTEKVDDYLEKKTPVYEDLKPMAKIKKEMWTHPEKGMLGGEIMKVKDDEAFIIKDFKNKLWEIKQKQFKTGKDEIKLGAKIKLKGSPSDGDKFEVQEVKAWKASVKVKFEPGWTGR